MELYRGILHWVVVRLGIRIDGGRSRVYLEGQGDLVGRLITLITRKVTLVIPIINPLTKSPDPPSRVFFDLLRAGVGS